MKGKCLQAAFGKIAYLARIVKAARFWILDFGFWIVEIIVIHLDKQAQLALIQNPKSKI
jgi:hypothetical protein